MGMDTPCEGRITLDHADHTLSLGSALALGLTERTSDHQSAVPRVVYLEGPLGAGKSTLARGLIRALGHVGPVPSPTYGIAEVYDLEPGRVVHLDLYRLAEPEEVEYLGVLDPDQEPWLILVEWPERGRGAIPEPDLRIGLGYLDQRRQADLRAETETGHRLVQTIYKTIR